MQHLAIDLGSKESQLCLRQANGKIIEERKHPTAELGAYLAGRPPCRVVLETCSEAFRVADQALAAKHQVRVVPSTFVKHLGVGARGIKTDIRDARALSEASCRIELPSVHVPSPLSRGLKARCSLRDALVRSRTLLINSVRGWLRTQVRSVRSGGVTSFSLRTRQALSEAGVTIPADVERTLALLEETSKQIAAATQELASAAQQDAICIRLMTAPGVGPLTALRFRAALDDISRFGNAHAVESYIGVTPGERSSSERQHRTGITKAGVPKVRWLLGQACWRALRTNPDDPLTQWGKKIMERRGKAVGVTAMCRKLAGILYAMWRDGADYDPSRGAALPASKAPAKKYALRK